MWSSPCKIRVSFSTHIFTYLYFTSFCTHEGDISDALSCLLWSGFNCPDSGLSDQVNLQPIGIVSFWEDCMSLLEGVKGSLASQLSFLCHLLSFVSTPLLLEGGCALSNEPYMGSRQKVTKHFHQSLWTVYIHLRLHHHSCCTHSGYIMTLRPEKRSRALWEKSDQRQAAKLCLGRIKLPSFVFPMKLQSNNAWR